MKPSCNLVAATTSGAVLCIKMAGDEDSVDQEQLTLVVSNDIQWYPVVVSEIWEVPLEVGSLYGNIPLCISERFCETSGRFLSLNVWNRPSTRFGSLLGAMSFWCFVGQICKLGNFGNKTAARVHAAHSSIFCIYIYVFFVYALPLLIDFVPLCSLILHNEHTWNPHFQFLCFFPRIPWRFGTCLLVATKSRGFGDDDLGKGRVANLWVFQPKRPFKITRRKRSSLYLWFSWY